MSHLQTAFALGAKTAEDYFAKEGVGKFLGRFAKPRAAKTMEAVKDVKYPQEELAKYFQKGKKEIPRHAKTMPVAK